MEHVTNRSRRAPGMLGLAAALASMATTLPEAQESASHRLQEQTFNAGGHPRAGAGPASASHRISPGSLGSPLPMQQLTGPTLTLDGGFVAAYPPPGEVLDVLFTDASTLVWDPEPSAGRSNLYRALVVALPGSDTGACAQQDLTAPTAIDASAPPPGSAFFYLVTVENRLGEDGTRGFSSSGIERGGPVCP